MSKLHSESITRIMRFLAATLDMNGYKF